ncbi:hypothetical protein TNCV_2561791 [Trichonephila clavipes]|uniref:Uncharacterized protein n=1 Tax=Trichonephila clavipes TaxID=2585209 RepID=A0A8X6UW42_TRICX|nr:hypothetical protein TNCV_2561791 [Trichonephila clavipes]
MQSAGPRYTRSGVAIPVVVSNPSFYYLKQGWANFSRAWVISNSFKVFVTDGGHPSSATGIVRNTFPALTKTDEPLVHHFMENA